MARKKGLQVGKQGESIRQRRPTLAKENLQISNFISIKETKRNFTHVEP
jgi:hypothetical protein